LRFKNRNDGHHQKEKGDGEDSEDDQKPLHSGTSQNRPNSKNT